MLHFSKLHYATNAVCILCKYLHKFLLNRSKATDNNNKAVTGESFIMAIITLVTSVNKISHTIYFAGGCRGRLGSDDSRESKLAKSSVEGTIDQRRPCGRGRWNMRPSMSTSFYYNKISSVYDVEMLTLFYLLYACWL